MSDAARASLAAVQAAQEAARGRARRETRRTRAWVAGILGGVAVGLLVFGPRVNRPSEPKRAATPPVAAAAAGPTPLAPPPATSVLAPPPSISPSPSSLAAGDQAPNPTANPAAIGSRSAIPAKLSGEAAGVAHGATATDPPGPMASAPSDDTCAESFGKHRWRLSIEACTLSFQTRPRDAALALRIAHAHHARARLPEAGEWANRAIALDPGLAEAYVILAHAEKHAGHPVAAVEDYRRYLTLAPRGWHAAEARAAVRGHAHDKSARAEQAPAPVGTTSAASAGQINGAPGSGGG